MLNIIYEDQDIIVVWKPVGMESQESRGLNADVVSELRKHFRLVKRDNLYVGVIHRLDKPVSGLLVYAKTSQAAARLSAQMAKGIIKKAYLAVLCGKVDKYEDSFADYLLKDCRKNLSVIVDKPIPGAKKAQLSYQVLEQKEVKPYGELTLAQIILKTGRHHQIRAQMSGHGLPLWGDHKYNPMFCEKISNVALAAYQLSFRHPRTGKAVSFQQMPDAPIFQNFALVYENDPPGLENLPTDTAMR